MIGCGLVYPDLVSNIVSVFFGSSTMAHDAWQPAKRRLMGLVYMLPDLSGEKRQPLFPH